MDFENKNEYVDETVEATDVIPVDETESEERKLGTGAAMLIGAVLTIATTAAVRAAKKGIAAIRAKRAMKKPEEGKVIEPTDVQIQKIQDPEEDPEE